MTYKEKACYGSSPPCNSEWGIWASTYMCLETVEETRWSGTVPMCCSVLQCAAVCCSVLQCVAVWCSLLQSVAVCCSLLQCVATCSSVFQCVPVCSSVQNEESSSEWGLGEHLDRPWTSRANSVEWHNTHVLQCVAVCCSVLQCGVTQYSQQRQGTVHTATAHTQYHASNPLQHTATPTTIADSANSHQLRRIQSLSLD